MSQGFSTSKLILTNAKYLSSSRGQLNKFQTILLPMISPLNLSIRQQPFVKTESMEKLLNQRLSLPTRRSCTSLQYHLTKRTKLQMEELRFLNVNTKNLEVKYQRGNLLRCQSVSTTMKKVPAYRIIQRLFNVYFGIIPFRSLEFSLEKINHTL